MLFRSKLDEMLSLQKSASDRTGLGYDFSSPIIASASTTIFVSPTNDVESKNINVKNVLDSENIDKGKSILGTPSKQDKKEIKNPRAKKGNPQSLNRRSSIFIITVEQLDILDLIVING